MNVLKGKVINQDLYYELTPLEKGKFSVIKPDILEKRKTVQL